MATIQDVAAAAGVSKTTISRYLNNRIELPAATAARIDAAIAKHDYRPNLLARRLSTGRTDAIGLVIPEIREPFFAELASAVEDEADRHGYTIFISSTRSDREREIASLNRLRDHHVDGLIMLTNTPDDGTMAKQIGKRRNVVLVDEDIPGVNVPKIFVENTAGARLATERLIAAGHRRIGYFGGPFGLFSSEERYAGYLAAMGGAGLTVLPELVHRGSFAPEFAQAAVLELARLRQPPTAIFASSDYLAIGAFAGLRQAGIAVPDQMSLISFDDTPLGALLTPPLTAIRQPIGALGRLGFQALHALMNQRPAPKVTRLPVELIERGSVDKPRPRGTL
ncbi:MAG TPA: LacI family DNA-binding transcriptional regulator [Devosia sp.]|nr:LacI family DNA-binding transcriptional regulator [Devosia sp.]